MQNKPTILTDARKPRGIVRVTAGGKTEVMPGWVSWSVDNNNNYRADTFSVVFALGGMPVKFDAGWWSSQQEIFIEILSGFPADTDSFTIDELTSWMYGRVDEIDYDPTNNTIEVSGRDLTAQMIDTATTQKWKNLTSSQIVKQIAASSGLLTSDKNGDTVKTTSIKVGKYYEIEHARILHQQTQWDLLTWLAQEEGFVVYVRGKVIYFQPKPDTSTSPYVIDYSTPDDKSATPISNAISIRFSRNLTLARDVKVIVKSWNLKQKKGFTKTVTGKHAAGSTGAAQTYSFVMPNLTPEQALKKAQSLLSEISAHEMRLSASMPADNFLDTNNIIRVNGTNTQYDQLYYPESIQRTMSIDEGYAMHISAKNHSTESTVTL